MQGTHCIAEQETAWRAEWGNDIFFSNRSAHSGGVCILFINNLNFNILQVLTDTNGIFIILKVKKDNHDFVLCNVYAPNTDGPDIFTSVFGSLREHSDQNLIMGGDFNVVQDVNIDRYGGRHTTNIKSKNCLKKQWRLFNLELKRYTWRRNKPTIKPLWLSTHYMCSEENNLL